MHPIMKKLILAAVLGAATDAAQAAPIQYNFAYDTGIGVLSGSLMGELQSDQNTIVIRSLLDFVKFDGVAGPSLPTVFSMPILLLSNGQTIAPARTTLDGSVQDIAAQDLGLDQLFTLKEDGFALLAGVTGFPIGDLYGGGPSFGNEALPYQSLRKYVR